MEAGSRVAASSGSQAAADDTIASISSVVCSPFGTATDVFKFVVHGVLSSSLTCIHFLIDFSDKTTLSLPFHRSSARRLVLRLMFSNLLGMVC
jgi:hypothetical protein